MQAGSFPAVFVTAGLALVARRPRLAIALAAGGTATWLLAKAVKMVVDRGRPEAVLHDVVVYGPAATGLGFPSGHAAVAALLMTVAAPYLTRPAKVVGWVVVALVAFTRVLIGAHLPLDALGGLLLGWTVGSVTNLVLGTPDRAPAWTEPTRTPQLCFGRRRGPSGLGLFHSEGWPWSRFCWWSNRSLRRAKA